MNRIKLLLFVLILFVFFLIPTKVNATEELTTIQFVDINLYQAIKAQVASKITSVNDNSKTITMTQSNLTSIRSLNLANKNITYLNGLDKFSNLVSLNLANNNISNLYHLRNLTKLTFLNLSQNRISNVYYLSPLTNLNYLYLGNNLISDVSVMGRFTKLNTLSLANNDISDISSFASLQSLVTLSLEGNRVGDITPITTLPNLTVRNLTKQNYEYSLDGNALANIDTNVNLPTFFLQAKQVGSPIYTSSNFTVTGATIGATPSYIVLRNTTAGEKTATVKINGGNADGSTLTLTYHSVLVTVTSSVSSPTTIYEGIGGTISFVVTANGETSTDAISFQITKNGMDVTNQFSIAKSALANASASVRIPVSKNISAGTYTLYVKYNNKTAVKGSFVIHKSIPVTSIKLDISSLKLNVNDTKTIKATVLPSNATNPKVTWSSSNSSVASVDSNGKIIAKNPGIAIITATSQDGKKTANCTVTVSKPVTGVSLSLTRAIVILNEPKQLVATITPSDATNQGLIWKSANPQIATVTQNGLLNGVSIGSTVVTVTTIDGGFHASCQVVVQEDTPAPPEIISVQSVTLNKTALTLLKGNSENLQATVSPSNATNPQLLWLSSDPSIASVDSNGKVTAKAPGTTQIVVTAQDTSAGIKQAVCQVVVKEPEPQIVPVKSISINKTSLSLIEGKSETLVATVSPSNATNKEVLWESKNPKVATVDKSGVVTAISSGSTQIIATAKDITNGTIQIICEVTVSSRDISSSDYKIEENLILNISPSSTVTDFIAHIQIPVSYQLYSASGNKLSQNSLIGTGAQLVLEDSTRYTLVVTGDLTGDGKLLSSDVLILKRHLVNLGILDGAYAKAADVNETSSITLTDLLQLKRATVKLIEF